MPTIASTKCDNFDRELRFTEAFRRNMNEPAALREAACMDAFLQDFFMDPQPGDLLLGRVRYPLVGIGTETTERGSLYYCFDLRIRKILAEGGFDAEYASRVEEMLDFWEDKKYIEHDGDKPDSARRDVMIRTLPRDVFDATNNQIANMGGRMSGVYIDYPKLVKLGIPGLEALLEGRIAEVSTKGGDENFLRGTLLVLRSLKKTLIERAARLDEMAGSAGDAAWAAELREMAAVLRHNAARAPQSFREGLQLIWAYSMAAFVANYGRMDVSLGDLYVQDIDSGALTEDKALALLQNLWRLINDRRVSVGEIADFNSRIVLGGRARPNEANADRFALLAMETTRTVVQPEPQLTLRFYEGQNTALMEKALDVIGGGATFPMLYNDDINIPACAKAFGVSLEEAEHYLPYGCGEYGLDYRSVGSPNCSLNLVKALEVTLHNGVDAFAHEPLGLKTGEPAAFDTFEKLFDAYAKQVEFYTEMLARRQAAEYEVEREMTPFCLISLLVDDCVARGRAVNDRGARYTGGVIETFGMVNAADSLTAIKKLVYDTGRMTLEQLVAALDANFAGYERERLLMLNAPKYGNDDAAADAMLRRVSSQSAQAAIAQAEKNGMDFYLIVNINNYYNVILPRKTAASADGRKAGDPFANGNTPTAGRDKSGVTAFLNSISSVDPAEHAGYSHNMKFSKGMFREQRPKVQALLDTYFARGGTQAMITVVSRGDLEQAMVAPEKYQNLIVRVGGFSVRFVELERAVQLDLINRTLYE